MRLDNQQTRASNIVLSLMLLIAATGCALADKADDSGGDAAVGGEVNDTATDGFNTDDGGRIPGFPALDRSRPAAGWRWESSLGIEVAIPNDWKVNDTDCKQTDAPSVVRGQGSVFDCFTPEPPTKQIVEIADRRTRRDIRRPIDLAYRDVRIGSVAAERGEGVTPDGRAAGWLYIPSIEVIVDVRVKNEETLHAVLNSVRVVDADHNQCATSRSHMTPAAPGGNGFAPSHASAVSVCYFEKANILQSSALIEGSEAEQVVEELNRAKPGRNADVPETLCLRGSEMPLPDAMLIVHGDDDHARIEVSFSGCTHRGLSNGRSEAQLTMPLLQDIMNRLACGYSFNSYGISASRD